MGGSFFRSAMNQIGAVLIWCLHLGKISYGEIVEENKLRNVVAGFTLIVIAVALLNAFT